MTTQLNRTLLPFCDFSENFFYHKTFQKNRDSPLLFSNSHNGSILFTYQSSPAIVSPPSTGSDIDPALVSPRTVQTPSTDDLSRTWRRTRQQNKNHYRFVREREKKTTLDNTHNE
jgi:hypothetical protein